MLVRANEKNPFRIFDISPITTFNGPGQTIRNGI